MTFLTRSSHHHIKSLILAAKKFNLADARLRFDDKDLVSYFRKVIQIREKLEDEQK